MSDTTQPVLGNSLKFVGEVMVPGASELITGRIAGLFGSGHERFVRWGVAEGPAARLGR